MNRRDLIRFGALAGTVRLAGLRTAAPLAAAAATPVAAAHGALIRLDSNENPLGLAPAAAEALRAAALEANRYPDDYREPLVEALAARHGVGADSVVLGNGSTEVLQMAVQAASSPNALLVMADPTFEAIARYQDPLSFRVVRVPLDASYGHDLGAMRAAAEGQRRPAVVYVCNPNNPTATLTSSAAIDDWIGAAPETVLFVIDEAYHEYVRAPGYWSAAKWVSERPNVVVTRTFSKIYAMAGLRLGYALAHRDTAARLREFMSSDNANCMALVAALASLEDERLVDRSRASNESAKRVALDCLAELGLEALPSQTNFVMHRIAGDVRSYVARMRERGIRVGRPFPPLDGFNRVSLGLADEMERWAEALRDLRARGLV
jgi:histidinol-phosphate aminotransferase